MNNNNNNNNKRLLSLSLIFLLLSSISTLFSSVVYSDDDLDTDTKDREGESQSGDREFVPRELVCDSAGGCQHKAAGALKKAKRGTVDILKEARDSFLEFVKQTLVKPDPKNAAKFVSDTIYTAGQDVLRNASGVAPEVVEAADQAGYELKYIGLAKSPFRPVRFLAGLGGLLGFVMAYGMCVWVVFISTSAYAKAIPRWQLPAVERVVHGVYCRVMAWCLGGSVAGHFLGLRRGKSFEECSLLAPLLMVLVSYLFLEPRATKALLEKMELEKQVEDKLQGSSTSEPSNAGEGKTPEPVAGEQPLPDGLIDTGAGSSGSEKTAYEDQVIMKAMVSRLNARVRKLNSWSRFLNVAVLLSLTWHLVCLGYSLQF